MIDRFYVPDNRTNAGYWHVVDRNLQSNTVCDPYVALFRSECDAVDYATWRNSGDATQKATYEHEPDCC